MKKLFLFLIAIFTFVGCGDDVTNINGYTDEQVQAKIDSTLDAQDVVVMNDTVYQRTVDTIYGMVVDTVTHELVDTIYQRVVDTVYNDLVDTIYQRVIDTVYNELVDTIYARVVDTVFTELERAGVDISKPRDTTITLYDTTDGAITAKIYKGVVYNNTFYEAKEYQLGMEVTYYNYGGNDKFFVYPERTIKVEDYARELNCSGSCGIPGNVHITYQCGELSTPDYKNRAYREKSNIKKFKGWRIFDEIDAYDMAKYLNMLVSDNALIYLNTINYDENSLHGDFTANVAKYKVASSVSTNNDKMSIKYICAYDLN